MSRDLSEILEALDYMSKEERTELAFEIISEGYCDVDVALKALGMTKTENDLRGMAEESIPITGSWEYLYDIPTKVIESYVQKVMEEMR